MGALVKYQKIIFASILAFSLVLVMSTYSETMVDARQILEDEFNLTLSKLSNKTIQYEIEHYQKQPISEEINGLVLHLDDNNNIIEDVRELYSDVKNYAIAVNRLQMLLTVYAFNPEKFKYNIPIVSFPISCNLKRTPVGNYYTSNKYRWRLLLGGHYAQYCTRYTDNMLFHSVLYSTPSNVALETETYNGIMYKLQSGGCIRLRVKDAKWLYENLPSNTLVVVYDSLEECPFKRATFSTIGWNQKYDPTDVSVMLD